MRNFVFAIACISFGSLAFVQDASNRFKGVDVSIPALFHDHYLGENSDATHYWHGENRDTKFVKTGGNFAVTEDPTDTTHPDLLAHSKKMGSGIFVINDKSYKLYGYGFT